MTDDEIYMERCIGLALLGTGFVAPNPLVGAVLVHENRIIGEGYHQAHGGPHAEVHCISSVKPADEHLLPQSTLYVSLEPCAHFGKTPPCSDLIIEKKIPRVVIGVRDPFGLVDGKGIDKLRDAGLKVTVGVLEEKCRQLNKRFFCFFEKFRPYITLKWAQSADAQIAGGRKRVFISSDESNRMVHKWRNEEMAVIVGTNTALFDDPELTTRHWPGKNPLRIVVDMSLRLPYSLKLFNGVHPTLVINKLRDEDHMNLRYYRIDPAQSFTKQLIRVLREFKIQSLLVEGGSQLLQTFIDDGTWDEARVITNPALNIGKGIGAPLLKQAELKAHEHSGGDIIQYYRNTNPFAN